MEKLSQLFIFLWTLIIYGIGLWIFCSGFFLRRTELPNISSCKNVNNIYNFIYKEFNYTCSLRRPSETQQEVCQFYKKLVLSNNYKETCWFPPKYKRAVILLVDALKYDFVKYHGTNDTCPPGCEYYYNKLPILSTLPTQGKAVLFQMRADPPTTTLQRLKGITTGSLPTFIDMSSNFASSEIEEDNLIQQLINENKKVIFMGDDTWKDLFPDKFHRSYFYPSFNVKDIHTVDNGIISKLEPELETKDWDVIVAHFLGVDHCGHTYGPAHPIMESKLSQMNDVIISILPKIENDTLLLVMSDHGMTITGDHGGDSPDETDSFLFAYNPLGGLHMVHNSSDNLPQVDLVPTLAALLDIPVPFSNLGTLIPTLVEHPSFSSSEVQKLLYLTLIQTMNSYQVQTYLTESQGVNNLPAELLKEDAIQPAFDTWSSMVLGKFNVSQSIGALKLLYQKQNQILKNVRQICHEKWAKFDQSAMMLGIFIFSFGLFVNVLLALNYHRSEFNFDKLAKFAFHLSVVFGLAVTVLLILAHLLDLNSFCHKCIVGISFSLFALIFAKKFLKDFYPSLTFAGVIDCNLNKMSYFIQIIAFAIHFSNSFILYEDKVTDFLLISLLIFIFLAACWRTYQQQVPRKSSTQVSVLGPLGKLWLPLLLLALFLIRFGFLFHKCRELQIGCTGSSFLIPIANLVDKNWQTIRLFASFACLFCIPFILYCWLLKFGSYIFKETVTSLQLVYGLPFSAICLGLHWIIGLASPQALQVFLPKHQHLLPQVVLISIIAQMIFLFFSPLLLQELPNIRKNSLYVECCHSLAILIGQSALILCLLLGDGMTLGFVLTTFIPAIIVLALVQQHLISPPSPEKKNLFTDVPIYLVVIWSLIAWHGFFATGHQTAIASIHWSPGVLTSDASNSHLLPGLLVVLETFGSQFLTSLAVPLLLVHLSTPNPNFGDTIVAQRYLPWQMVQLEFRYLALQAFKVLGTMLAGCFLQRHLMTWQVFAPNFIFTGIAFIVSSFGMVIGQLFMLRTLKAIHTLARKQNQLKIS